MRTRIELFFTGVLAVVAAGCAPHPAARVRIVQPHQGDTLTTPDLRVVLEAQGVEIVPATEKRPGTGHHHLFFDTDLTPPVDTIPKGVTGIIHLGRGQTEFTFTDVPAGAHRLAEVADGDQKTVTGGGGICQRGPTSRLRLATPKVCRR